jgi:hypothetical protein
LVLTTSANLQKVNMREWVDVRGTKLHHNQCDVATKGKKAGAKEAFTSEATNLNLWLRTTLVFTTTTNRQGGGST